MQILIAGKGIDDNIKEKVRKTFLWTAKQNNDSRYDSLKGMVEEDILFEDFTSKSKSHYIDQIDARTTGSSIKDSLQLGCCLCLGQSTYETIKNQAEDCQIEIVVLPEFKDWGKYKDRVLGIVTEVTDFLFKKPSADISPEDLPQGKKDIVELDADIQSLSKYLTICVANNRHQAVMMQLEGKPVVELLDATRRLRADLSEVVPIIVADHRLADEKSREQVSNELITYGYNKPFLISVNNFIIVVRLLASLARSGKATINLRQDDDPNS